MSPWKVILWTKGGVNLAFIFWLAHATLNPGKDFFLGTGMHTETTFVVLMVIDAVLLFSYLANKRRKAEMAPAPAVARPRPMDRNIHYIEPKYLKKAS